MTLEDCEVPFELQVTDDGKGFQAMLELVLRQFNLGSAAVALGLCRAVVAATAAHLNQKRPVRVPGQEPRREFADIARAQLATMKIDTDGLSARVDDLVEYLERPRDTTLLRVLETKAAAGEVAIDVTSGAMRVCGGAAFSKHMAIERLFRDAHACSVMAPTGDVLRGFIAKAILGMPLF
jgi:alkylation response protein AidB-like acyl-CoA dehydrogenase